MIPADAQWADLEPLLGVADRIMALYVFQPRIRINPLTGFHQLAELVVQPGTPNVDLDLDSLPALRTLSISRPTRLHGGTRSRLRDVDVERPSADMLGVLAQLPRLERLKVYGAFPVRMPPSLRVLDLSGAPAPSWVDPLPALVELHLNRIMGLTDLSLFAESTRLSRLVVEDVPTFGSCAPFDDGRLRTTFIGEVPLRRKPA